ncbi:MAG TPA: efflux RND transporter permease subunit, partial [Elusimicrobiales bacterium]|nr:efflux RND transporter permease subunit [Elusimicrobiales bacterium]
MKDIKNKIVHVLALPKFAVEHPVAIAMIYSGLLVLSLAAFSRMGVDMFPDVAYPVVSVITTYQGASAEEVEAKITRRVEAQTSTVRNLKDINSISKEGVSVVMLKFEWGTDLDSSANDVRDRLGMLRELLPDDADDPMLMRIDMKDIPVLIMAVNARESFPRIYNILDTDVSNMLKRIPGVGNVIVRGGQSRQINVDVDRQRLEAYGLTLSDVKRAVLANNLMQPAGKMQIGMTDYMLRVPGEFSSPDEIGGATVGVFRGQAIRIRDVAQVNDSHPYESERVMSNGSRGAILMVQKRSEANAIQVVDAVKKALPEIHRRIPSDITIKPLIDTSADIKRTLGNLSETLFLAAFLILVVILFFLRRVRPAAIVFVSMPISLLDSFLIQYLSGYTINMISLLGLTIAIGLVVDDALVVMENQIRRQEELGEDPKTAAVNATSEVGRAVTMATLASCVVFLPMLFASGLAGVMFRPLSVVMCVTLLLSLLDSLTLNPMLSSLFLHRHKKSAVPVVEKLYIAFEKALVKTENGYKNLIAWVLDSPKKVVFGSVALLVVSLAVIPFISTEFMSEQDSGQIEIVVELPVGTRVEVTHNVMEAIEKRFKDIVPAEWITNGIMWRDGDSSQSSMSSAMSGKSGSNIGTFMASLCTKDKRSMTVTQINAKLRAAMTDIPGIARVSISGGGVNSKLIGSAKPMCLNVYGYDLESADAFA